MDFLPLLRAVKLFITFLYLPYLNKVHRFPGEVRIDILQSEIYIYSAIHTQYEM